MIKRKPDWQIHLNKYIAEVQSKKFKYGKWDCCHFGAGAIKAITGSDLMKEYRGKYKSKKEAMEILDKKPLFEILKEKLGKPVPAAQAKRGDLAFHEGRVGIIIGRYAIFLTDDGYHQLSIQFVDNAFKVGF
jgi:hypothetical protein